MIPKIQPRGASFAGLAAYLTHDPKETTTERVAWTHTINLAHDQVPSAVDEMLWTSRAAELLKQEAGIRAGGRATENVVKHVSLNWSPEDDPSREHMVEAAEGFLRHMKWQEHQALLVAHSDKDYAHVHVMINAIHPETGLRLNEDFEQRRAQAWALAYELEQGRVHCEQRLANSAEREDGPTRPAWLAFQEQQKEFERDEKSRRDQEPILLTERENPKMDSGEEWRSLKNLQREERMAFFADGKSAFSELRNSVYREVREEFRERWSEFYTAQKEGGDGTVLAETKAVLLAEQKAVLATRRDEACGDLRGSRDIHYRELLDDQREVRLGLRWRQEAGLDNAVFLEAAEHRQAGRDVATGFREAAAGVTDRSFGAPRDRAMESDALMHRPERNTAGMKSGTDVSANLGLGLGFAFASIFDSLADGLVHSNPGPTPPPPEPEPREPDLFRLAANEARSRQEQQQTDEDEWRLKQRNLYGE